jgi:hypothetical protein
MMVTPTPNTLGKYLAALDGLNPYAYNNASDFAMRVYKNAIFGITDKARGNGWRLEGHKVYCIEENMQQIFLRHLFRFTGDGPRELRFIVADSKAHAVLYNLSPDGKCGSTSVFFEPQVADICNLFNEYLYIPESDG